MNETHPRATKEQSDAVVLDMYLEAHPTEWPAEGVRVTLSPPFAPGGPLFSTGLAQLRHGELWLTVRAESQTGPWFLLRPLRDVTVDGA